MNLQQTKNRIQSIQSTKKITKAMELVSISKLKKAKQIHFQFVPFYQELTSMIQYVQNHLEDDNNFLFHSPEESEKNLVIIVSSSLGLCGGYNHNVFHYGDEILNPQRDELIVFGTKGCNYYKNLGFKIKKAYEEVFAFDVKEKISQHLANLLLKLFQQKKYKKIQILYTTYVNSLTFVPTIKQLLPLVKTKDKVTLSKSLLIEPSAQEVLAEIIPFYLAMSIKNVLFESLLSEQASRRLAMENATNNAEELEEQLMLEYHKTRQAMITQEINEITGSSTQ